ncbi:MAG TPA: hypothetical protein VE466_13870 [Acidimicrobiales bacterium]|nr:hypothetical protein [Acidimicrobiales bacterium]
MLERNAAQLDVAATLSQTSGLHPREVVHALGAAVLRTTGGDLPDDATVVVLGEPPRFRIPDPIRSGPGTEDDLCENGVESSRLSSKTRL